MGDTVRRHASGYGPRVTILEPERARVLGGPPNANDSRMTCSFYLLDGRAGTTRLLERGRSKVGKGLRAKLSGPYPIDPIGFVMSRRMLRTIQRLSDAAA